MKTCDEDRLEKHQSFQPNDILHIYLEETGSDDNNGFSQESAIHSLDRVYELILGYNTQYRQIIVHIGEGVFTSTHAWLLFHLVAYTRVLGSGTNKTTIKIPSIDISHHTDFELHDLTFASYPIEEQSVFCIHVNHHAFLCCKNVIFDFTQTTKITRGFVVQYFATLMFTGDIVSINYNPSKTLETNIHLTVFAAFTCAANSFIMNGKFSWSNLQINSHSAAYIYNNVTMSGTVTGKKYNYSSSSFSILSVNNLNTIPGQ